MYGVVRVMAVKVVVEVVVEEVVVVVVDRVERRGVKVWKVEGGRERVVKTEVGVIDTFGV